MTSARPCSLRLGVNLDHVATLRQVRRTPYPSVAEAALLCLKAGAHGITVHLREDRRHIQDSDVRMLKNELRVPLNLEMANAPEIVAIALEVKPDEACIVPERRQELTTEGGLDVVGQFEPLRVTVGRLTAAGIRVSLFIEPDPRHVEAAARLGAPVIELHTGRYADAASDHERERELQRLIEAARFAHQAGLQVNAGHGLNKDNLRPLLRVPYLHTLNIGHSVVARAIFVGLENAVRELLSIMSEYRGGEA